MARQQPGERQECSLRDELETIITLVSGDARQRGVRLVLEEISGRAVVRADGEKLRQAFLNIVINALQATPAGGSVAISTNSNAEGYEICFRDTGCGIDAAALGKIFEPFFTTKVDGTGLGLAVTKKIIESHGGQLTVASEAGMGTTVVVKLPAHQESAANSDVKMGGSTQL